MHDELNGSNEVPYKVGEVLINIHPQSSRFTRTCKVVGFDDERTRVFTVYEDGSFGVDTMWTKMYLKLAPYLPAKKKK